MGKKRSNKKKKLPIENVSKSSNGKKNTQTVSNSKLKEESTESAFSSKWKEKNTESVFNSELKEKNNKCEKDTYFKGRNKISDQSLSTETLPYKNTLGKTNNPGVSVSNHNAGANKSSKSFKPSSMKPSNVNNSPHTSKVKPVTLAPFEIKDLVLKRTYPISRRNSFLSDSEEGQYDCSRIKDSSVRPKSHSQEKVPELLVKDFNDKSYLTDFLGDDCYESDKDVAGDFFQPVFNKYQNHNNPKKEFRGNVKDKKVEKNCFDDHILSSHPDSPAAYNLDEDFEINRLEYLSPYSPIHFSETGDFEDKIELKENMSCCVDAYKNSKETFAEVYRTWLPGRIETLKKLKALLSEVHADQLNFNKSQVTCRQVGCLARCAKTTDNQVVSFLGSFTAFLSDAATGIVSVAQAFNIDSYQSKFKEIMEEDAKISKRLYTERSNCVVKYHDIEEVMRKFHPDSFSTAVSKISDSLEINKYWKAMKEAYGRDDMPQLLNIVSKFFDNAFQSTKLEEVKESVLDYVSDNPKALEACKSATQATCGYLDTWTLNQSRHPFLKGISSAANGYLIAQDKLEISRLNNAILEDLPQSKLESQIEDAIDSLETEMKEINHTYYELFKIYVDSNGYEWEISEMC